jgi:hypothetical protein
MHHIPQDSIHSSHPSDGLISYEAGLSNIVVGQYGTNYEDIQCSWYHFAVHARMSLMSLTDLIFFEEL